MTVDDALHAAGEVLAGADVTAIGPGLALQLQQALQVAAGGEPRLYVATRDALAAHLGRPVAVWALAGATTKDAAFACHAAARPQLHLIPGSRP